MATLSDPDRAARFIRLVLVVFGTFMMMVAWYRVLSAETPRPAAPVEPVTAILGAFEKHPLVALSDAHGNEQAHAFLLTLLRDPRFPSTVNDIVVEFGNQRYQDVMDRFVRGEEVPDATLRHVWQDLTMSHAAADAPMFEEVFRVVREVNGKVPRERQLRVLLGEPPIDWDRVHSPEDQRPWFEMRDSHPAALIQVEVLAKKRRALLLYGQMHYQRQQVMGNLDMSSWQAQTIVSLIERAGPTRVFVIWTYAGLAKIQPDVASWPVPSLALVRGTVLGDADIDRYVGHYATGRFAVKDNGSLVPVPREQWRPLRAEDQFDAVLYLGPPSTMTQTHWSPSLCTQPGYLEMRKARHALVGGPQVEMDRLLAFCADVAKATAR